MSESDLLVLPNQMLQIFAGSITAQFKIAVIQVFYCFVVG